MKHLSLLFIIAICSIAFTSCEKCTTCSYDDGTGTTVSEEFCSSDEDDRNTFEAGMQVAAAFAGTTATCTEK